MRKEEELKKDERKVKFSHCPREVFNSLLTNTQDDFKYY